MPGSLRKKGPWRPWIYNFVTQESPDVDSHVIYVLRSVNHTLAGDTVKEISDGEITINATFTKQALEEFEEQFEDESPPDWNRSTIILQMYSLKHLVQTAPEHCEFILCIDKFSLWTVDTGFRLKQDLIHCMDIPAVKARSQGFWTLEQAGPGDQSSVQCDSMSSVPLSQLLQEMGVDSQDSQVPAEVSVQVIHSINTADTQGEDTGTVRGTSVDQSDAGPGDLEMIRRSSPHRGRELLPGGGSTSQKVFNKQPDWMSDADIIIPASQQSLLSNIPEWQLGHPSVLQQGSIPGSSSALPGLNKNSSDQQSKLRLSQAKGSDSVRATPSIDSDELASHNKKGKQSIIKSQTRTKSHDEAGLGATMGDESLLLAAADVSKDLAAKNRDCDRDHSRNSSRRSESEFPWLAISTLENDPVTADKDAAAAADDDDGESIQLSMDEEEDDQSRRMSSTPRHPTACDTSARLVDDVSQQAGLSSQSAIILTDKDSQVVDLRSSEEQTQSLDPGSCSFTITVPVISADLSESQPKQPQDQINEFPSKQPRKIGTSNTQDSNPASSPDKFEKWTCQTPEDDEQMLCTSPGTPEMDAFDKDLFNIARQYKAQDSPGSEEGARLNIDVITSDDVQVVSSSDSDSPQLTVPFGAIQKSSVDCAAKNEDRTVIVHSTQVDVHDQAKSDLPQLPISPVSNNGTGTTNKHTFNPEDMDTEINIEEYSSCNLTTSRNSPAKLATTMEQEQEDNRLKSLVRRSGIETSEILEQNRLKLVKSSSVKKGRVQKPQAPNVENEGESSDSQSLLEPKSSKRPVKATPKKKASLDTSKCFPKLPGSTSKKKYDISVLYGSATKKLTESTVAKSKGKKKLFNMNAILEDAGKGEDTDDIEIIEQPTTSGTALRKHMKKRSKRSNGSTRTALYEAVVLLESESIDSEVISKTGSAVAMDTYIGTSSTKDSGTKTKCDTPISVMNTLDTNARHKSSSHSSGHNCSVVRSHASQSLSRSISPRVLSVKPICPKIGKKMVDRPSIHGGKSVIPVSSPGAQSVYRGGQTNKSPAQPSPLTPINSFPAAQAVHSRGCSGDSSGGIGHSAPMPGACTDQEHFSVNLQTSAARPPDILIEELLQKENVVADPNNPLMQVTFSDTTDDFVKNYFRGSHVT